MIKTHYCCDICGKEINDMVCPIDISIHYPLDTITYNCCDKCTNNIRKTIEYSQNINEAKNRYGFIERS